MRTAKIWLAAIAGFVIGAAVAVGAGLALLWPTCGDGGLVECGAPDAILWIVGAMIIVLPFAGLYIAGTTAEKRKNGN